MKALSFIKVEASIKSSVKMNTILKNIQANTFVLYTLPKMFNEDIVNSPNLPSMLVFISLHDSNSMYSRLEN
jgi:hypothetical protein